MACMCVLFLVCVFNPCVCVDLCPLLTCPLSLCWPALRVDLSLICVLTFLLSGCVDISLALCVWTYPLCVCGSIPCLFVLIYPLSLCVDLCVCVCWRTPCQCVHWSILCLSVFVDDDCFYIVLFLLWHVILYPMYVCVDLSHVCLCWPIPCHALSVCVDLSLAVPCCRLWPNSCVRTSWGRRDHRYLCSQTRTWGCRVWSVSWPTCVWCWGLAPAALTCWTRCPHSSFNLQTWLWVFVNFLLPISLFVDTCTGLVLIAKCCINIAFFKCHKHFSLIAASLYEKWQHQLNKL